MGGLPLYGSNGSLNPADWSVASCTLKTAQQIPDEQAPFIDIVYNPAGYFVPACIVSQGGSTTITFHGLSPQHRLRAMKNSGNYPNPIVEGEPHTADFTLSMINGGPYGFYIEGVGSDGPPGETGLASGAIYLTGTP